MPVLFFCCQSRGGDVSRGGETTATADAASGGVTATATSATSGNKPTPAQEGAFLTMRLRKLERDLNGTKKAETKKHFVALFVLLVLIFGVGGAYQVTDGYQSTGGNSTDTGNSTGTAGDNPATEKVTITLELWQILVIGVWFFVCVVVTHILENSKFILLLYWMLVYWPLAAILLTFLFSGDVMVFGQHSHWVAILFIIVECVTLVAFVMIYYVYPRFIGSKFFRDTVGAGLFWNLKVEDSSDRGFTMTYVGRYGRLGDRQTCQYEGDELVLATAAAGTAATMSTTTVASSPSSSSEKSLVGSPDGWGAWRDDAFDGEILTGSFVRGRPVAPFSSRQYGTGDTFAAIPIAYYQATDDDFASTILKPTNVRKPRCGVSSVECSILGSFYNHLPCASPDMLFGPQSDEDVGDRSRSRSIVDMIDWMGRCHAEMGTMGGAATLDGENAASATASALSLATSINVTAAMDGRSVRVSGHVHGPTGLPIVPISPRDGDAEGEKEEDSGDVVDRIVIDVVRGDRTSGGEDASSPNRRRGSSDFSSSFSMPLASSPSRRSSPGRSRLRHHHHLHHRREDRCTSAAGDGADERIDAAENGRATAAVDADAASDEKPPVLAVKLEGGTSTGGVEVEKVQTAAAERGDDERGGGGPPDATDRRRGSVDEAELLNRAEPPEDGVPKRTESEDQVPPLHDGGNGRQRTTSAAAAVVGVPISTRLEVRDWIRSASPDNHHKAALVYVPGFNSCLKHSLETLGQFMAMTNLSRHVYPVLFAYPCGQVMTYRLAMDAQATQRNRDNFGRLMRGLATAGIRRVHFMSHSMGVQTLLGAFDDVPVESDGDGGTAGGKGRGAYTRSKVSRFFRLDPAFRSGTGGDGKGKETSRGKDGADVDDDHYDVEGDNLMICKSVTMLNPDFPVDAYVDHAFLAVRRLCGHVTVVGDRNDQALWYSSFINGGCNYLGYSQPPALSKREEVNSAEGDCADGPTTKTTKKSFHLQQVIGRSIDQLYVPDDDDDDGGPDGAGGEAPRQSQQKWDKRLILQEGEQWPLLAANSANAGTAGNHQSAHHGRRRWLDMDAIDTTLLDTNIANLRHGGFTVNPILLKDIEELITTGRRAAGRSTLLHREGNIFSYCHAPSYVAF